jgi:hypothetical protein
MAASENPVLRFNRWLLGILFAICAVIFVIGLIVLPFATAIRLIGLAAIVAIPYLFVLVRLAGGGNAAIPGVMIVLIPGFGFVPYIAGEANRLPGTGLYSVTVFLIALPVLFLIRRRWPNLGKRTEPSVQA